MRESEVRKVDALASVRELWLRWRRDHEEPVGEDEVLDGRLRNALTKVREGADIAAHRQAMEDLGADFASLGVAVWGHGRASGFDSAMEVLQRRGSNLHTVARRGGGALESWLTDVAQFGPLCRQAGVIVLELGPRDLDGQRPVERLVTDAVNKSVKYGAKVFVTAIKVTGPKVLTGEAIWLAERTASALRQCGVRGASKLVGSLQTGDESQETFLVSMGSRDSRTREIIRREWDQKVDARVAFPPEWDLQHRWSALVTKDGRPEE